MMTSGLVVMIDPDAAERESTRARIRAETRFTLGERNDAWLPVTLEAEDAAASEWWRDWLCGLPGVVGAEVVFIHWDEAEMVHATA